MMPPAGLNSPSAMSRMVSAAVCQPLAAKPRNTEFFARLLVEMERLRIELPGECLDLLGVDLEPAGVANTWPTAKSSRY